MLPDKAALRPPEARFGCIGARKRPEGSDEVRPSVEERRMVSQSPSTVSLPVLQGARAGMVVQALAAMILGVLVVGTVGFAPVSAIHNAAHDVRHSSAFPCH